MPSAEGLIDRDPFDGMAASVGSNEKRQHYVDLATTQKILDACPDVRWRLIVALCRFAGLRCPSEVTALKWTDILWDQDRFRVTSCKTEHHEHGQSRIVPLFPELLPHLRQVFEAAEPGAVYVISRYGRPISALRTQFEKILERAGVPTWPKLFVNMRASAATDLSKRFGSFAACAWLGHGPTVAAKHYWQVTEADFQRAITPVGSAAQNPAQCAQPAAQYPAGSDSMAQEATPQKSHKNADLLVGTGASGTLQNNLVGDAGLGPATSCV